MDYIRQQSTDLIILTALAAEAEALIGRKKYRHEGNMVVFRQHVPENSTASVIQCGIGRDTLLGTAARQLKKPAIVGNIGVSGGLAPDLAPGTVILGDRILTSEKNDTTYQDIYIPDGPLLDFLESVLRKNGLPYRRGSLLCTQQPLDSIADKAAAYQKTGALAVDMESAGAAEAARQALSPFFCIRIICDPAGRKVAKKLLAGVDSRGNSRPMRLINPLVRHPWLFIPLMKMAGDFTLALAGMKRVWKVVQKPLVDYAESSSATRTSGGDRQCL
jgi:adenosylhomocysteine nucleosidase